MACGTDIQCPFCKHKFVTEDLYSPEECPRCREGYYWDVQWEEGYDDEYSWLWWDRWDSEAKQLRKKRG